MGFGFDFTKKLKEEKRGGLGQEQNKFCRKNMGFGANGGFDFVKEQNKL